MKKSLFLLGVAAAVFSGCSNQEVMDVAEYANQPIEFTTFVDKTTRSGDVTSQNFQKFWVFAQNKGTGDQNWADAFTNVQVSKAGDNEWLPINTYYWEKNKEFRFAGYANGESQLNKSIVSYDAGSQSGGSTSGLLTFTAYSTDGKNDLVAAMGNESNYTWDGTASGEAPKVSMTFRHMLSKLTFTFKTKMANTYTVAVNNLRIESATTKSTGTYHKANEGTITWSTDQLSNTTGTYTFDNITDVTADAANEMFNEFFQTEGDHPGTVYETEIGNKIYYSEKGERGNLDIFSKNKLLNEWSNGRPLPGSINESGNANYPFVLSDGVTIYYATDGEGLGGYDIFVTRYNTNTDSYLTPENVGMPFNSPYNDYMYVIDEYNNLGWFASDRFQPEEKVCIYVFIPNSSKQTYNYEAMDPQQMIRLAQIHSLKETWKDENTVAEALQRLKEAINHKPQERRVVDFEFVIDDNTTYYLLSDFQSPKAKQLFQSYRQLEKDYLQQEDKLDGLRQQYATANQQGKEKLAPAILDLEKRILQMNVELDALGVSVRNAEKTKSK